MAPAAGSGTVRPLRWAGGAIAVAVVVLLLLPGGLAGVPQLAAGSVGAPTGRRVAVAAAASGLPLPHASVALTAAQDWPELHRTPTLDGVDFGSPLNSTSAAHLGVAWATDLFGAALDSPVAAYDPSLHEVLAYIGTEAGTVEAVDVANGQIVWGVWLGSPIRSSPLVANGSVYVATFSNPAVFRLNASTGAVQCSVVSIRPLEGTPTLGTPSGGPPTLYIGSEDDVRSDGAIEAIDARNCSEEWSYSNFTTTNGTSGSWVPAAYATTANGTPVVVFGTSDPDAAVYALDAATGALLWKFRAANPSPGTYDIGGGAAIGVPGANGFPQGVVYVPSKYGILYALALNNGTPIWSTNFDRLLGLANGTEGGRSTPALDGENLIFGEGQGLLDLNARNGREIWSYRDPARVESIASPAVAGGRGTAVVATADLTGALDVVSVAKGTALFRYTTGGYVTASPAVVGGNLLLASTDGFLYDFDVGGGTATTLPSANISSPTPGALLAAPAGNLILRGNATAPHGLAGVEVAIRSGGAGGPWWDGRSQSWVSGPFLNWAHLGSPGANASAWSFAFPPAATGGSYAVTAYAVAGSGQSGIRTAEVAFGVGYRASGPHLRATPEYVAPGAPVVVNGGGFGANETVALRLGGRILLGNVTASATGALPATTVRIPSNTSFGEDSLGATGESSGRTANGSIIVANSWTQFGGAPGHPNYEPNDPTFQFLVHPGGNYWVDLAWDFTSGSPMNTSPAIVDGVAYVADAAGNLYALDVRNGGILWNWSLPGGPAAITGAPAVNASLGLVLVGAADGTVDAVGLANGTTAWRSSVGGHVAAPLLAGDRVYATTTAGKVVALDAANGSRVWTRSLPSAIDGAATLSAPGTVLVVGQANGNVTGIAVGNGTVLWNFATGGAVRAAAAASGNLVYIGSTDHHVYALDAATGRKVWSFAAGAPILDTGAIVSHYTYNGGQLELAIGADNGELYVLDAANGSLFYHLSVPGEILGMGSAEGIVVVETSKGIVSAVRAYTPLDVWKYDTGGSLRSAPVLLDGTIYVAASDGHLYAFTTFGQPPD